MIEVRTRTLSGGQTALGSAGSFTLVVDRPLEAGGGGLGFNGGQLSVNRLDALVVHVDRIAEIPNSLRGGTPVRLVSARCNSS